MAAVAQHRDLVGQLLDLMHAVRDVEQRKALIAQAVKDRIDAVDVRRGERRGSFVEDQELGIAAERLGDLDDLPARQRQVADPRARIDVVAADPGEQFLRLPPLRALVDEAEAARRPVMLRLSATERSGMTDSS